MSDYTDESEDPAKIASSGQHPYTVAWKGRVYGQITATKDDEDDINGIINDSLPNLTTGDTTPWGGAFSIIPTKDNKPEPREA